MKYRRLIDLLLHLRFVYDTHTSHPEENTLSHVTQAFVKAKRESDDKELWVASLFHDIGKVIEIRGHENFSVDILKSFGYNNEKVIWLVENHMRIHHFFSGDLKRVGKVKKLVESRWLPELVHLRRLDKISRNPGFKVNLDKNEINLLLEETSSKIA